MYARVPRRVALSGSSRAFPTHLCNLIPRLTDELEGAVGKDLICLTVLVRVHLCEKTHKEVLGLLLSWCT